MHSVDPKLFKGKTVPIDYAAIPEHCQLVVVTGGEPTLFDLMEVRSKLMSKTIEIESNSTRFPEYVDFFNWNLSPKLKGSEQKTEGHDKRRLAGLNDWAAYARKIDRKNRVIFKFVVGSEEEFNEADYLVQQYQIPKSLVFMMAEGYTQESQQHKKVEWLIELCKVTGYNFSPRIHVMLWGEKRGV